MRWVLGKEAVFLVVSVLILRYLLPACRGAKSLGPLMFLVNISVSKRMQYDVVLE